MSRLINAAEFSSMNAELEFISHYFGILNAGTFQVFGEKLVTSLGSESTPVFSCTNCFPSQNSAYAPTALTRSTASETRRTLMRISFYVWRQLIAEEEDVISRCAWSVTAKL